MRGTALAALLAALLPILVAPACSSTSEKPVASSAPLQIQHTELRASEAPATRPPGRVLARVQFRDHVLVVRTGSASGDMRYDVESRGGALLARSLSRSELGLQFPAIADQLGDSMAIDASATTRPAAPAGDDAFPPARR